jgi:hypothetical protein
MRRGKLFEAVYPLSKQEKTYIYRKGVRKFPS